MLRRVHSVRLGMLLTTLALGAVAACGGDDKPGRNDDAGAGRSNGGGDGSGNATGTGLPSRLPSTQAQCESATGAEACYFDGCCDELVACAKNAACAKTYGCYLGCDADDATCLLNCAGSSLEAGAEDFGAALSCLVPLMPSCGGVDQPGAGGSGSDPGDDTGPLGTAKDDLGWDLNVADQPLVAELELETEAAVSREITVDGGTITATASDGTTYELTMPEGAVYGPTVITLTPLSSLAVAPLEGPAFGVQIEPDGLELMASPTLRITPPDGDTWPVEEQIPLAITGADQTVSLALLEPASEELELVLTHFSAYGALLSKKGLGATLSEGEIRSRFGGDAAERLQSAAAERLGAERVNELMGAGDNSESVASLIGELLPEYEKHVLEPRLAMAGESCAAGKLAIQTELGHARMLQLLGVDYDMSRFIGVLPTVAAVCLREEYELCRDEHIITRVLPVLLSFHRQAQLLGLSSEVDGVSIPPAWVLEAEENVKKCLKFKLRFDSDVLYGDDSPDTIMRETVSAEVPVELMATFATLPVDVLPDGAAEVGALIIGGPNPLTSESYAVSTNEECRTIDSEQPADGELYVGYLSFVPGITTDETPGGSPEVLDFGISLAFVPNLSKFAFTQQQEEESGCGDVVASGEEVLSWSSTLGPYLLESYSTASSGAWLDQWDVQPAGQIIAVKDIALNGADGNKTYKGPVNLVLFHTPDP